MILILTNKNILKHFWFCCSGIVTSKHLNMSLCNSESVIWVIIVEPLTFILLLSMIPIIYKYGIMHHSSEQKKSKLLIYSGFIFFISIFLTFLTLLIQGIFYCTNLKIYLMLSLIFALLYAIQFCLLLLILFIRLYFVFHNTILQLSKFTTIGYLVTYILMLLMVLFGAILQSVHVQSATFVVLIAFILILSLVISMMGLFIYKLIQVYKFMGNDQCLISMITKAVILTFISIFITFLAPISIILFNNSGSIFLRGITTLVIMADLYTNFICIILEYEYFNGYYHKLCHCLDEKCTKLWKKILGTSDEIKAVEISKDNTKSLSVSRKRTMTDNDSRYNSKSTNDENV